MQHSVSEVKLNNGSCGLFIDVPFATVTSFDMVFRAGDYLSPKGKTDTAHIMEHLVLGANKRYPDSKDFSKEFSKYGAYNNAYTGDYHMGYEAECEASETERILDLLCVAIESPLFTEKDFKAEVGNVREELKMRRNNEDVELSLKLEHELGFVPLSYTERVKELGNIKLSDIEKHYKKTHTASNLMFIIAGPIKNKISSLTKRLEQIELAKGSGLIGLPTEKPKALSDILLTQNSSIDNICYRFEIALPLFTSFIQRDSFSALLDVLFNGFHSRVFGELREKGLAYGINGSSYETKDNTVVVVNGQVQADNFIELLGVLKREMNDIATNGVTNQELEDLQKRAYGEIQRHHQTVGQVSNWYKHAYTMRSEIIDFKNMKKRLESITIESVKESAEKVLSSQISGLGIMYNPQARPNIAEVKQSIFTK